MSAGRGRRTGILLILVIIVILVIGIGILYLMPNIIGGTPPGGTPGAENITPTATFPPPLQVIVAARDIPRGARLSVQDVTVISWPNDPNVQPPTGALTASPEEGGPGLEQVEGRIARTDILNGQPVLDFMLTPGDQPTGLVNVGSDAALLVPSGQIAIAMPTNRFQTVAYAVRQGDHVDLLMSFRFVDVDEDFQTILPNTGTILTDDVALAGAGLQNITGQVGRTEDGPFPNTILAVGPGPGDLTQRPRQATQLVLDNLVVLRVGDWPLSGLNAPLVVTPSSPATPSGAEGDQSAQPTQEAEVTATPLPAPDVVTLAMSRQDALVLKYALETGAKIDLALRSAVDNEVQDIVTDTVTLQYILDFYNVAIPPKLPIAQDPRIDSALIPTSTPAP